MASLRQIRHFYTTVTSGEQSFAVCLICCRPDAAASAGMDGLAAWPVDVGCVPVSLARSRTASNGRAGVWIGGQ